VSAPAQVRPSEAAVGRASGEADYVEFWRAGAPAVGTFCCASCGRAVRSVRRIPDCPSCGSLVWEQPTSSPFGLGVTEVASTVDPWFEEEVDSVAGLTRGIGVALVLAPACWLIPALVIYALIRAV
jgi:hypothetical protein